MNNRWLVLGIFYISSILNYVDRQVLSTLAPLLREKLSFTIEQYGILIGVFNALYAFSAPVSGYLIDRFGLNRGTTTAVGLWSIAGLLRGFASSFGGLMVTHSLLGLFESAGIPSTAKASHRFLKPAERAFGPAISSAGLSIGGIGAATALTWVALNWGWQWAFILPGVLGLLWIPLWLAVSRSMNVPEGDPSTVAPRTSFAELLRDPQLWGFAAGNFFAMTIFALWTFWTTEYFVKTFKLSLAQTNYGYAWMPAAISVLGAMFGAWLSRRLTTTRGLSPEDARRRTVFYTAIGMTSTALVPWMPTAGAAALLISFTYFCAQAQGVNFYTLPVDVYGQGRAAFAVSLLTTAFGVLNLIMGPLVGRVASLHGFAPVCYVCAFCPLIGYAIITVTRRREEPAQATTV